MNIEVQAPERLASTCSLAAVVAAAEVGPLVQRIRGSRGYEVRTLCVLDELRSGEDLEPLGRDAAENVLESAAGTDLILISERPDLMSREVAFNLAEAASRPVPIRRVAAFIEDRNEIDCGTRSDPEAIAQLIDIIERHATGRRLKRLADITVAALGLILALPLMLVIAALIRLDSPGHPLLRQERLGQHRRPFTCLKFRTMCADAERATGPVWASADDPRITRIGRFLRKSRLDELPQLVNILKGEMSIVGPRPIRAFFADQLAALLPIYNLRFIEKPGLTGWAQINFGYPQTVEEQFVKFRLELEYIRRRTFWFDLLIMLRTVSVVARMKGL